MLTSPAGRTYIKKKEGLVLVCSDDGFGNPTVGWGHLGLPLGTRITVEQAEAYLTQDLAVAEKAVNVDVHVPLTPGQFDVLVSFTMNLGAGALAGSTLLKKLNTGDYASVRTELLRWDHATTHGVLVEVEGLKIRREEEAEAWTASSAPVNPIDPAGSRTLNGAAVGVAGGVTDVAIQVTDAVNQAQWSLNAGNVIGILVGLAIIGGALWVAYSRLDDAGLLPWRRKSPPETKVVTPSPPAPVVQVPATTDVTPNA